MRRQFLDWYIISRKTFYQIVTAVLGILLLTGGVVFWKRNGQKITNEIERKGARLVQASGDVSIRRAKNNQLEKAFKGLLLEPGDMILTSSDSTAVIQYIDYSVLRVKADSTVILKENAQNLAQGGRLVQNQLIGGVVNISTSSSNPEDINELTSKNLSLRMSANTQATISASGESAKVTVGRGSVTSSTNRGDVTEVINPNIVVEFSGERKISQTILPPPPNLKAPENGVTVSLKKGEPSEVLFSWSPVPDATRYQIQISDSPYFLDKALRIDAPMNATTFAWRINSLDGFHWWRVQAVGRDGREGVWSEESKILLLLQEPGAAVETSIFIDEPLVARVSSSLYEVSGTTEPGVQLKVNGRAVVVDSSGKYTTTVDGLPIRILAQDARGRSGQRIVSR